jgi:diadenosine tetraphosphate (Ap4A) HIT family hydrolase
MSCPFCSVESHRLLLTSINFIAFGDAYPVTAGHTLVVPRRHVSSIYELSSDQQSELWETVAIVRELLMKEFGVNALNIGINDGIAAGQTVEHAHVHVIPRRPGDVPDPRGGIRWIVAEKAQYWP